MDVHYLWRCHKFMVTLLKDREYTFTLKQFQTNKPDFCKYFTYVLSKRQNVAEAFQITGSCKARDYARKQTTKPATLQTQEEKQAAATTTTTTTTSKGKNKCKDKCKDEAKSNAKSKTQDDDDECQQQQLVNTPGLQPLKSKATTTTTTTFVVNYVFGYEPTATPGHMISCGSGKFGKKEASMIVEASKPVKAGRLFLVTAAAITPYALRELEANIPAVEVWPLLTCLSDYPRNFLVPCHRRLSLHQRKALYNKQRVSQAELPRLLVTDPVARYWGYQPGDVIEIMQATHVGYVPTYRVVTCSS